MDFIESGMLFSENFLFSIKFMGFRFTCIEGCETNSPISLQKEVNPSTFVNNENFKNVLESKITLKSPFL